MIDIGANLSNKKLIGSVDTIMAEARKAGVTAVFATGTSPASSECVKSIAEKHHDVFFTAGCHPHTAKDISPDDMNRIEQLTQHDRCVAVGECGLDYDRMFSPKKEQTDVFESHLAIARRSGKPLFLHERAAHDDFVSVLKNAGSPFGIVHCFTGNKRNASTYLDMGMDIGITGWISDQRRNHELVEALKHIPLDRLHVETDAPYLAPRNIGKRVENNLPQYLPFVVSSMAEILGIASMELASLLTDNTRRAFPRMRSCSLGKDKRPT